MKKQKFFIGAVVTILITLVIIGLVRFLPIPMLFKFQKEPIKHIEQATNSPHIDCDTKPQTTNKKKTSQSQKNTGGKVVVLNNTALIKTMAKSKEPMVMKFYTNWCPACIAAKKVYPDIAKKFPKVSFYSINLEEEAVMEALDKAKLIDKEAIQAIPTFIFYQKGKVDKTVRGFSGQAQFEIEVTKHFSI